MANQDKCGIENWTETPTHTCISAALGRLLKEYNAIIDQHESDKSLMIEIPDAFNIEP